MATRRILPNVEPALHKKCRTVTNFDARLHTLLDDMRETLIHAGGVGLAAPQVGVLRRAIVVLETNVPEGEEPKMLELINPEIVERSGEQYGPEGCLSLPGRWGLVSRPMEVRVKAQDRDGNEIELHGTGLTARCYCHEIDHLNGVVFTDVAERMVTEEELESGSWREDKEE